MTTMVPTNARLANADRDWAISLLAERRSLIAQAADDHREGWHVGLNCDDIHCADCLGCLGDMPAEPTMSRAEYLSRNIAHTVAQMQLNADLVSLERQSVLER